MATLTMVARLQLILEHARLAVAHHLDILSRAIVSRAIVSKATVSSAIVSSAIASSAIASRAIVYHWRPY
jgi:hypothetical protein